MPVLSEAGIRSRFTTCFYADEANRCLDALHDQDHVLAADLSAEALAPDKDALRVVANRLDQVIANGEPERAKALLAILVAELRVNGEARSCRPTESARPWSYASA
jgi:hypothetical protein